MVQWIYKIIPKFERTGLHAVKGTRVDAPIIEEYPLTLECTVEKFEDEPYGLRVLGRIQAVSIDKRPPLALCSHKAARYGRPWHSMA